MIERIDDGLWRASGAAAGPSIGISFGVHGDERPPIDAGLALVADLESGALQLSSGSVLFVHGNTRASEQDRRWSEGGIDLNRCFHVDQLCREPELWEQARAKRIAVAIEDCQLTALVDFHCVVEPGDRFMMQHPPAAHAPSREAWRCLEADTLLCDPELVFGAVSLDEYMSTRGRAGVCYETGWIGDPDLSSESVRAEMQNLLAGYGMLSGHEFVDHGDKRLLELAGRLLCEADGFTWSEGVGENLQDVAAGTLIGRYADGRGVQLEEDATLIFPKKKKELLQQGKPLVLLARRA